MPDRYVYKLLGLKFAKLTDVLPALIEAKRAALQLKRLINHKEFA